MLSPLDMNHCASLDHCCSIHMHANVFSSPFAQAYRCPRTCISEHWFASPHALVVCEHISNCLVVSCCADHEYMDADDLRHEFSDLDKNRDGFIEVIVSVQRMQMSELSIIVALN